MELDAFGHQDPDHRRVPWQKPEWEFIPVTLPSDLIDPLTRNDHPSASQISLVEEFRQSTAKATKETQENIRQIQKELERLKALEEKLHKESFACDVIMAPIRRLPDDIIYQIFTSDPLLPDKEDYTDPHVHIPSILSQVSRSWRNVAHSIPQLWHCIRIDCAIWNYKSPDLLFERINLFSRLSRSLPLTIHVDETRYGFDPQEDAIRSVRFLYHQDDEEIANHDTAFARIVKWLFAKWPVPLHRAVDLSIDVAQIGRVSYLLSHNSFHAEFDTLRLLDWGGDIDRWSDAPCEIHPILKSLPKLRRLWLAGFYSGDHGYLFDELTQDAMLAHHSLKILCLPHTLRFEGWIQSLQVWPRLEAAWYHIYAPHRASMNGGMPIQHDHLKVLNLIVREPYILEPGSPIFPLFNVVFPALEQLNLYCYPKHGLDFIRADFQRMFPSLTQLYTEFAWIPGYPLPNFAPLFSLSTASTLVICVHTHQLPPFTDILEPPHSLILLLPEHLILHFKLRRYSAWSKERGEHLTTAITRLLEDRSHKRTTIRYTHFRDSYMPIVSEEQPFYCISSDTSSSTGSSTSCDTDGPALRRESNAILSYFLNLRSELGEGVVEVTSTTWGGQVADPYNPLLEAFTTRYFS